MQPGAGSKDDRGPVCKGSREGSFKPEEKEEEVTVEEFVKENRDVIDTHIEKELGAAPSDEMKNDEEREIWVMNDLTLYNWAMATGVDV